MMSAVGGRPEMPGKRSEQFDALKVDVIVAASTAGALAAKQATTVIPIVFGSVPDPVAAGLIASLARPGDNVTGLSNLNADLVGKCLEILTQAVPSVSRVAVLWQPGAWATVRKRTR